MRVLGLVSLVQLVLGILGLRKALDERLAPDVPGFAPRSRKEVADRHWIDGTALSAPSAMLVVQAIATAVLLLGRTPRVAAARTLGVLGSVMVLGYPLERIWRESIATPDRDLLPLTLGGFVLALKMAILGFAVGRRPQEHGPAARRDAAPRPPEA